MELIDTIYFFRGINVLNTKSELERVMEKRTKHRKEQERLVEEESKKSPFQKMLEGRARRLEMMVIIELSRKYFLSFLSFKTYNHIQKLSHNTLLFVTGLLFSRLNV